MLDGTYTGLKASVADFLNRQDLTAAIPDFIALAEAQISRRLIQNGPVRRMMARSDATINSQFVAVPTDFMGVKGFYLSGLTGQYSQLKFCEPEQMNQMRAYNSYNTFGNENTLFFTVVGQEFQFFPDPTGNSLSAELTYWQRIPALSATTTNWLLTINPDAYLYGALLQSAPYLKDDNRVPLWENAFATILNDIVEADKLERNAPFLAVPRVQGATP